MTILRVLPLAAALAAAALPARAHHGLAAVTLAGPEGPGAALETTSALPLPRGTVFTLLKAEHVPFERRAHVAPEDPKARSLFGMAGLGYGLTPWLSAYAFQPLSQKAQDGVGTASGVGDPTLMLTAALKWDEGLRLVPERESLDELEDWHLSLWLASTLPLSSASRRDGQGVLFAPDMQLGFGAPSPSAGVAVLKALSRDLTLLADASYQHFFPHTYRDGTRYRFGGETRLDAALAWRAYGRGPFRLDLVGELNGLHLQRDRERGEDGRMAALDGSGGAILYAGGGLRGAWGPFTAALAIRRAAATALNERGEQQGAEGLERFRASLALGWVFGGG